MTLKKRDVPQSVFDSPQALAMARKATKEATDELNRTPRHLLDEGNPNHPRFDSPRFSYRVLVESGAHARLTNEARSSPLFEKYMRLEDELARVATKK